MSLIKNLIRLAFGDREIGVQNPLPVNSSIHYSDIDWDNSDFTNWSGDPKLLFESPFSESITNDTTDNPKVIILAFKRTISASQIGFGENNGGDFSNLKISLLGSLGVERNIYNDSTNNTKKNSLNAQIGGELFNSIKIEFYTTDRVDLSNITIQKAQYSINGNHIHDPVPLLADSVYSKDVDLARTITTDWSGDVVDLFGNLTKGISNITSNNPKTLLIYFNRAITTNALGIGSETGSFSNLKIIGLFSGGVELTIYDNSTDNTTRNTQTIQFSPIGFIGLKLEFHTVNAINITNVTIIKSSAVVARMQALKPDGTVINVDATNGGNLKTSLEELENQISINNNTQLRTTLFDSLGNLIEDITTSALKMIDYNHHEIHNGKHFYFDFTSGTLGSSATYEILIITPDNSDWGHFIWDIYAPLGVDIEIYENTDSVGGTSINIFNNDRNSSETSGMTITHSPTVTSDGTLIKSRKFGSATASVRASSGSRQDYEHIKKQNTKYLIRITSNATLNYVSGTFTWYEHANKS